MSKYFLSICAIVKNEAPYLSEWLAFHRLQGVEHFYIYHNDDERYLTFYAFSAQNSEYRDITYIPWPGPAQQNLAYQDCLVEYGHESEWIAFIDVDEFLWSPAELLMFSLHKASKQIAAFAVHWMLFGSNGHKEKTDGLVIERFTRRAGSVNHHCKCICRPSYTDAIGPNPHCVLPKSGYSVVDERSMELSGFRGLREEGTADILRINHYHVKSRTEYFSRKLSSPDANSGKDYTPERVEIMFNAHDLNEVEDITLRDLYAEKIKETV